jgi:hypothetical protein
MIAVLVFRPYGTKKEARGIVLSTNISPYGAVALSSWCVFYQWNLTAKETQGAHKMGRV